MPSRPTASPSGILSGSAPPKPPSFSANSTKMSSEPSKILRIGVVQVRSGKVTETRLIKRRETVTVGASPKNTFPLPSPGLPQTFSLFEMKGGQYQLRFTETMEGKVSVGDEPQIDFPTLVAQGQAKKTGDSYALPLSEQMRGKVSWGDSTLLFQFVAPPPQPAKMVLPEVARGQWRNVDRLFYALLLCSLAINFGLVASVSGRDVSEEVSIDEIPDRFAKLIIPGKPLVPPTPKEEPKVATDASKKADRPKEAPKKERPPQDEAAKAAAAAIKRSKLAQEVAQRGLLKLIGADSASGAGAIDDVLGSGSSNQDIAAALAGAGGVAVANADSIGAGGRKGGGSGKAAGIGDLSTKGGGQVGIGGKAETRVSASVSSTVPEVESSTLDRNAVSRYVNSRQKAIQGCYERELKLEPALKGKVAVRITINTQGKVSETEIDEDTLHSDAVVSCIKGLIRFWKFPFTPDSDAAVQFSWNFVSTS